MATTEGVARALISATLSSASVLTDGSGSRVVGWTSTDSVTSGVFGQPLGQWFKIRAPKIPPTHR